MIVKPCFRNALFAGLLMGGAISGVASAEEQTPPPSAKSWADLGRLPDWSGAWTPGVADQARRVRADPVPWTAQAAKQVAALEAADRAGHPKGLFVTCLPQAMPSFMLITHNAIELLFTPGRVTLLGEGDGNRLRRIYTDGRPHQADPDPSFYGDSIGHWERDVLVVDTIGVLPQTVLAVSESVGLPNNGGLHVVERLHLVGPDLLQDDLVITAPHILTRPWSTSRIFFRHRDRTNEIVEGVCLQGDFRASTDAAGDAVFVPRPGVADGNPAPVN